LRQLLLIDNDVITARRLQISLLFEDVKVVQVEDGTQGLERYLEASWDIIIIGEIVTMSGISLLMRIRSLDAEIPVIAIITSAQSKDRARMLHIGANDVLSRPFAIEELVARIANLLNLCRSKQDSSNDYCVQVDELFIDTRKRLVFRAYNEINLTPTEYELLVFLSREAGKILSRRTILSEVWGYEFHGDTNIVDVYIRYLRIKIDKGYKKKLIKTIRGIGYMISP
jgi:DNA-binding response OmpR family regulator